jgi:hypothetical protein
MAGETPVGTLEGRVVAADTGRPIAEASVRLRSAVPIESKDWITKYVTTDTSGAFRFADIPAGTYTIEANGRVHSLPAASVKVTEGQVESLNLELAPDQPYLRMYVHQQLFTTNEKPEIVLDGFTESDEVAITMHRINIAKLLAGEASTLREVLTRGGWRVTRETLAKSGAVVSAETTRVAITKRDSEGVYHQNVTFPPHGPGVYIIIADADQQEDVGQLSVSDISLIAKESGQDVLAYVVRPDTGEPVAGAQISILEGNAAVAGGKTDASGLWKAQVAVAPGGEHSRLTLARYGGSAAFITSYVRTREAGSISIYAYTDRPVYRPGHQVYFKGIVRKFAGDAFHTPQQGQARVEVRDRRNSMVYAASLPLSRFGSFHGDFKLPEYAPTGGYEVTSSYGGRSRTTSFDVAEYRKPEFSVAVEMPKKRCVSGERIKAKVRASYYFGAPVVGAQVRYTVFRSTYWSWSEEDKYEVDYEDSGDYEDYGDYGETAAEGVARTGRDGIAEIEFTADIERHGDFSSSDQQYTVSAYVTDPSRREAEGEGSIIATQGDFDVSVEPEDYVSAPGETARFKILVADYDHRPQAGVELDMTASRVRWQSDEEENNRETYTQVASAIARTDAQGRAIFGFKPAEPGSYVIRTTCRDRRGNRIRSSAGMWVAGGGEFGGYKYPELQIILDKKVYGPGDTAKVLINSEEAGVNALVTVEGRHMFEHKLVKLSTRSTVVELPIRSDYRPNFYVGVCYVKNKRFVNQEARAKVSLKEQTIRLTVTPNKRKYEPGEQATYLVKATDSQGRPVEAEVSLGVVDEAVYAIREDDTTPIRDFFYTSQPNSVETHFSFPEIYLSGDKAGYTGKVRKEFLDTAFWYANIVTDAKGEASVRFKLPDNLTTWRATARACTIGTAVGQTTSTAVCSKNLLVRLETPRFLIQKDEALISAIVHNYLPERQRVAVTLQAEGLEVRDRLSRTVKVASQGMEQVEWRVFAPKPGKVFLTAYATCPAANDAMQLSLPVRPHGQREVQSRAGSVAGSVVTEKLLVRADSVSGASEIRVRLAPSLASALLGSLDYFAQYPYGCTEQTMSCFLPDVVIWRTLKSLKISNPELEKKLPDMVGKGLSRLYDFQNEDDGGWGWCEYGQQDLWMTSYVVFGLITARSAGFRVNSEVLESGLSSLESQLEQSRHPADDRIYALYVLSLTGRKEKVKEELQPELLRQVQGARQTALAAMTLANLGDEKLAKTYLARLWTQAVATRGDIHWSGESGLYDEAPTETTALALMAVVKLTPQDPKIPRVVRWLLGQRELNHWYSTRDTAMILYALSDYLKRSGELQPDFTATVSHNGRVIGLPRFDKSSLFQPEKEMVIRPGDVRTGANSIRLEKVGTGVLYYTIELVQYVEREELPTTVTGSGITVTREYRKLIPRWDERSRVTRIEPADYSTTDFRSGDSMQVRLTVNSPREYEHVIVEDYLPAGCEAFDRGRMEPWEWNYWWVDRDVRDERVTFYVETLPAGKSVLEYEFRAALPGSYHAMPPLVQAMYQPEITASGAEVRVRVRD